MKKISKYLSFEKSKEYIKNLNFVSRNSYQKYIKKNNLYFLPYNARNTYLNNGWISWGDFLGNNNISKKDKLFLSFEEAKKYVHTLNIKTDDEWRDYIKSNIRNMNIPFNPHIYYKNDGWKGIGDWLGTNAVENKFKITASYEECENLAKKLNIHTSTEWHNLKKENIIPDNYPYKPNIVYKNKWVNWNDFLENDFLSYNEAKIYVHKLSLNSESEWREYRLTENKPYNIPSNPYDVYKNNGWKGFHDFLGYDKKESKGELKIKKYLEKNNIKYIREKVFDDCKDILKLRFDFYLPDFDTLIEFDGIQHFIAQESFGGEEALKNTQLKDNIKNKWCKKNNKKLIRITYLNYKNIDDILKEKLL